MKKLILLLIILLIPTTSFSATRYIHRSGTEVGIEAIYFCTSGAETETTPQLWAGAWYDLISYMAEWLFVVGMGQSNLVGNPVPAYNFGTIPTVTVAGIEIHTDETYTNPLAEPTGNDADPFDYSGQADGCDAGSIWLALANKYYDETGQKVIVLSLGANATVIANWVDGGDEVSIMSQAKVHIAEALAQLTTDEYDFEWTDIIWLQGWSDCYIGETSEANYESDLGELADYFDAQFSSYSLNYDICYTKADCANMTSAKDDFATATENADVTSTLTYVDPTGTNHFVQAQLNTIGETIAGAIITRKGY